MKTISAIETGSFTFNPYFHLKGNQADIKQNYPVQNINQNNDAAALESQITEEEIWYAISKLKSDQSGGLMGCVLKYLRQF